MVYPEICLVALLSWYTTWKERICYSERVYKHLGLLVKGSCLLDTQVKCIFHICLAWVYRLRWLISLAHKLESGCFNTTYSWLCPSGQCKQRRISPRWYSTRFTITPYLGQFYTKPYELVMGLVEWSIKRWFIFGSIVWSQGLWVEMEQISQHAQCK